MAGSLNDLQNLLNQAAKEMPDKALRIIGVEGLKFIKKNFRDQGFNDTGIEKWQKRKTTDKNGRDLTRYSTNRNGRSAGSLTKFGLRDVNRAILVGHDTGGDKLINSFKYNIIRASSQVNFRTPKKYAGRHNEGLDGMPKRQFMGKSKYLDNEISQKIKKEWDKLLR
jgi:phage gpG-like protein